MERRPQIRRLIRGEWSFESLQQLKHVSEVATAQRGMRLTLDVGSVFHRVSCRTSVRWIGARRRIHRRFVGQLRFQIMFPFAEPPVNTYWQKIVSANLAFTGTALIP